MCEYIFPNSNKKWLVVTSCHFCSWSRLWNIFKSGGKLTKQLQNSSKTVQITFYWSLIMYVLSYWKKYRRSSCSRCSTLPNFLSSHFLLLFCSSFKEKLLLNSFILVYFLAISRSTFITVPTMTLIALHPKCH